jgi:hypothetical protein
MTVGRSNTSVGAFVGEVGFEVGGDTEGAVVGIGGSTHDESDSGSGMKPSRQTHSMIRLSSIEEPSAGARTAHAVERVSHP